MNVFNDMALDVDLALLDTGLAVQVTAELVDGLGDLRRSDLKPWRPVSVRAPLYHVRAFYMRAPS